MAVFEGSEKRLEIDFHSSPTAPPGGLRSLTRPQLDELLSLAACKIISTITSPALDAHVLSESSLFLYTARCVLKTCGTTRLLQCVGKLLEFAKEIGMEPCRVRYSRASFLFPEDQPNPHNAFDEETAVLQGYFWCLGNGGSAYVLGDYCKGLQWHVFIAEDSSVAPMNLGNPTKPPMISVEMCLTGLDRNAASKFFRSDNFVNPRWTTTTTGISDLLPGCDIDDYVFEPCGYSMNGLKGDGFLTVHITPEEACSYASVELSGFTAGEIKLERALKKVASIFKPQDLYLTVTTDEIPINGLEVLTTAYPALKEYSCRGVSTQAVHPHGWIGFCWLALNEGFWTDCSVKSCSSVTDSDVSEGDTVSAMKSMRQEFEAEEILEMLRNRYAVDLIPSTREDAVDKFVEQKIKYLGLENTFYVFDIGMVYRLYRAWTRAFPRVQPFYAVKCNPDPAMLSLLGTLGAGFDCASDEEVNLVMGLGVPVSRIIFANACKRPRDIRSAKSCGVNIATFDNKAELQKIKEIYPDLKLILRIRADDPDARCQLGNKYGAESEEIHSLLQAAKDLQLTVVGISFHVGSGACNPAAFTHAIWLSKEAFELGKLMGFDMHFLDIGGGFPGGKFDNFGNIDLGGVVVAVNDALSTYFPEEIGVKVIAEPGRYFAEAAAVLATNVYGHRERWDEKGNRVRDYYITDGLYGSFNCILYDHATVTARALKMIDDWGQEERTTSLVDSTLFGPTCDGLDTILRNYPLPELVNGDWVLFPNMGAYTLAGASNFNGFNAADVDMFYVWSQA